MTLQNLAFCYRQPGIASFKQKTTPKNLPPKESPASNFYKVACVISAELLYWMYQINQVEKFGGPT